MNYQLLCTVGCLANDNFSLYSHSLLHSHWSRSSRYSALIGGEVGAFCASESWHQHLLNLGPRMEHSAARTAQVWGGRCERRAGLSIVILNSSHCSSIINRSLTLLGKFSKLLKLNCTNWKAKNTWMSTYRCLGRAWNIFGSRISTKRRIKVVFLAAIHPVNQVFRQLQLKSLAPL